MFCVYFMYIHTKCIVKPVKYETCKDERVWVSSSMAHSPSNCHHPHCVNINRLRPSLSKLSPPVEFTPLWSPPEIWVQNRTTPLADKLHNLAPPYLYNILLFHPPHCPLCPAHHHGEQSFQPLCSQTLEQLPLDKINSLRQFKSSLKILLLQNSILNCSCHFLLFVLSALVLNCLKWKCPSVTWKANKCIPIKCILKL